MFNIEKIYIKELSEVAFFMYENISKEIYLDTCFIGRREDVIELTKILLNMEDYTLIHVNNIEIIESEFYDYEYRITIDKTGGLTCVPMWNEEYETYDYFVGKSTCAYVADDCSVGMLDHILTDTIYIISYDNDFDYFEECEECEECEGNCTSCPFEFGEANEETKSNTENTENHNDNEDNEHNEISIKIVFPKDLGIEKVLL